MPKDFNHIEMDSICQTILLSMLIAVYNDRLVISHKNNFYCQLSMENRIHYITNLKDCISSRNSFAVPTQPAPSQQSFLHDNMEYQVIRQQIKDSKYYNNTNKHVRIRLEKWLSYLDKIKTNKVWLKSRNTYVKMLNLMCYCECILSPFNQLPPDGQLPTLSKNQINRIIDQIERQLKTSGVTSRKTSQNIEINKQFVQNEMENILFPAFSQEHKRFQTNQSNSFFEDESSTLPLKLTQIKSKKRFETEVQQSTLPLKISKQSEYYQNTFNRIEGRQKSEISQIENTSERRFSLSTKRNSKQNIGKQNNFAQDTLASIHSHGKVRKNTLTPTKTIALKQIKLNEIKRPNIPLKLKNLPKKFKDQQRLKEDSIQKEYWQQNSLLSREQNQNTPKYINNFTSQHAASDECVQIMSFRQKEGEVCDCTGNMLGGGWLSELFKKINI